MGNKQWKCKKRDEIYKARAPDEVSFVIDRISLPSGFEFDYVYVDCPYEVVYVVGVDKHERVLLIRQHRYLIGRELLEIPAGSPEGGESLEQGAVREFEEESGYMPGKIQHLTTFYSSSGLTNQKCHIFLATDLRRTRQKLDISEDIQIEWAPLEEVSKMVFRGEIENVGAAYGILLSCKELNIAI